MVKNLKLEHLTVYIMLHHFLKDMSILTLYIPLDAPTLNPDHEMDMEMIYVHLLST
jgi:hypothetical protein